MKIVVTKKNIAAIGQFKNLAEALASKRGRNELQRGVTDAGRKVKTVVQKTVVQQMALKPGNYNSIVVAGTRGQPMPAKLAFDIYGVKGGAKIEKYKGLRSVKAGRQDADQGTAAA